MLKGNQAIQYCTNVIYRCYCLTQPFRKIVLLLSIGYFRIKSRIEKYSKLQLLKMLRGISNVLRIWGRSYPPLGVKERLLETVRFLKFQGSRIVIFQIEFQYKEPKYKCFPVIFQYPSDFSITSAFQIFPVSSVQWSWYLCFRNILIQPLHPSIIILCLL